MAMEPTSWLLPAAKGAYQHRKEIQTAWQKILATLSGKKTKMAFTGMAGVGKTVLFDYLRGEGYKRGYQPPGRSTSLESKTVSASQRRRLAISVVPGQVSPVRRTATEELFEQKNSVVDGAVHVVSNGFVETRESWSASGLENGAFEQYREYRLDEELEDLNFTCELIRKAVQKFRKPKWLIVAVTKVDLYHGNLDEARQYYSQAGDSRFIERVKTLVGQVGSDNFSWTAAPVCTWLENFEWKNTKVVSTLKPQERDQFLASFANLLESYCER
jgi:GTPase SAR1 family protein